MCQRIGRPPISTIGFGRSVVSSESRVPSPPARITAFIQTLPFLRCPSSYAGPPFANSVPPLPVSLTHEFEQGHPASPADPRPDPPVPRRSLPHPRVHP